MYFKKKSNIIYRDYNTFGYITDNRNFGYTQLNDNENYIGDKILSQSGSVFFKNLTSKPQHLDILAKKIQSQFENIDIDTIKNDAKEFYLSLESDGFVISGLTIKECDEKESFFSYNNAEPDCKCVCSKTTEFSKSTQDFFNEYFNSEPQLTNIHIEIASKCNEKCIHCYIPNENKTKFINPVLFYNILEQCKNMNVLHITISGGEPLLHSDFVNFLRKCREYNFSVSILSNLTLLNKNILEEMKRTPLLNIQTSLYAMDATIHDTITQVKGSFEKTKSAILELIENNIPLQISCPIMKQNINHYKDVIDFGEKLNVKVGSDYAIIAKYNNTTQNLDNRLSVEDIKKIIDQQFMDDPYYIDTVQKEIKNKKEINPNDFICSVCYSSICISETGNVYPCAGWQGYILGNINKNPLYEIWTHSPGIKYLRNLRKKDFPECIKCEYKAFCTMCMVRNANEHPSGNPLKVNKYFCDVAKISKEIFENQKHTTKMN